MFKNAPLISIVTIVYNGKDELQETIDSVVAQTYRKFEYIVIDGGSDDGTLQVIKDNVANGNVHKFISSPDNGIADAFNRGLELATGELIGLINCGDAYFPDTLSSVAAFAMTRREESCIHGDLIVKEPGVSCRWRPKRWPMFWKYIDMPFFHPTLFVPKTVYERIGWFDAEFRIAMDYDFVLRAMDKKIPFSYLEKDLAIFSNDGISATQPYARYREGLRCQIKNGLSPLLCYPLHFFKFVYWFVKSHLKLWSGKTVALDQ